ncbi:MAG: hypothetical protein J6A76_04120, partial [Oscillospiraceae bacterium]|nr:hypothetical protein [Oscillospiraceae bacterium]
MVCCSGSSISNSRAVSIPAEQAQQQATAPAIPGIVIKTTAIPCGSKSSSETAVITPPENPKAKASCFAFGRLATAKKAPLMVADPAAALKI